MSGKRRQRTPRFLRHRTLMAAETVLLVGVANHLFGTWVTAQDIPNWAKTLFVMAGVLGLMGGLFLVLGAVARRSVAAAHDTVQSLPLPMPALLVHGAAFAGLFLLYAWVWGYWPPFGGRS